MKSTLDFHPKFLASLASYSKEKFTKDLMAGIIVGIVALPLAIAFGIASGVSPEKGLITAIIGGFIVSFLGGNSVQIGGPTGAFIVIVYGIIQAYGLEGLAIATFMAGLILVLMGCFRLGTIIKFIPYPIVVGFTSGIALTIFATQIKDLLGLSMDSVPADFISKWVAYFQHIETTNFWSLGIGILSILIIAYTPRISNKIPGSLMAIILMTVLVYVLERLWGIEGIETIGDRFNISNEVPEPQALNINMETITQLLSPAFTIAVLGAIESLLSATVADGNRRQNQLQYRAYRTGSSQYRGSFLRGNPCHRSHCPYHDQYQQRRAYPHCRYNTRYRPFVDIPVPYAAYQARAHVVPRRCIDRRFL